MNLRPMMVLLVDDDEAERRQVQDALGEAGFGVQLAVVEDGEQALRVLRREPPYTDTPSPDLVLLDLDLAGGDGRGLLAEIKDDERTSGIPVVVLGSEEEGEDPERATELGVHGYVRKPLVVDDFLEVVAFRENI